MYGQEHKRRRMREDKNESEKCSTIIIYSSIAALWAAPKKILFIQFHSLCCSYITRVRFASHSFAWVQTFFFPWIFLFFSAIFSFLMIKFLRKVFFKFNSVYYFNGKRKIASHRHTQKMRKIIREIVEIHKCCQTKKNKGKFWEKNGEEKVCTRPTERNTIEQYRQRLAD